jgi:hypothetical protein
MFMRRRRDVDHRLHDGVHPLERAWLSQIRWRRVRHGTEPADRGPNVVWAVDFQLDATTDGRLIKIVSIVDEHTRECLGGLVDRNITSDDLIAELDASPSTGAIRPCCAATTAPSSSAPRWPTGPRTRRPALHPTRPALAQRLHRVVQQPRPRRVPEHQHVLVPRAGTRGDQRLEGGSAVAVAYCGRPVGR